MQILMNGRWLINTSFGLPNFLSADQGDGGDHLELHFDKAWRAVLMPLTEFEANQWPD